jgi:Protein of unknown function (DUF1525)
MKTPKPLRVEVLVYAPVAFFHCPHCELAWQPTGMGNHFRQEQLASSLPEDLTSEYRELSDWVREMMAAYGERLDFRVIDAASIEGWLKSVRYRLHRYPAIVVDGKEKFVGLEHATAAIRRSMELARAI